MLEIYTVVHHIILYVSLQLTVCTFFMKCVRIASHDATHYKSRAYTPHILFSYSKLIGAHLQCTTSLIIITMLLFYYKRRTVWCWVFTQQFGIVAICQHLIWYYYGNMMCNNSVTTVFDEISVKVQKPEVDGKIFKESILQLCYRSSPFTENNVHSCFLGLKQVIWNIMRLYGRL